MGRLSTTSNPTGLHEIDRSRVGITVTEFNGRRSMQLTKLELGDLGLRSDLNVIGVARAGKTTCRLDLGTVADWRRTPNLLEGLDRSDSLRFRIVVREKDKPLLIASAERLRPISAQGSESLLPMEPADLGQQLWRLDITDEDGPVLKFNVRVFPSAAGAENYLPFAAMVLPEAMSQVLGWIAKEPEGLNDEGDLRSAWAPWLDSVGAGRPPTEDDEKEEWRKRAVGKFCDRSMFADVLSSHLKEVSVRD